MKRGNELTWPIIAIICSVIIASGIYLGLRDSRLQPTQSQPWWEKDSVVVSDSDTAAKKAPTEANKNDPIVYVTRTGECYHRGSCGYLRRSKIPMKLSQAKNRYRPCSRCSPPR